jgi:hypothetical protein
MYGNGLPLLSNEPEKSPWRSASVGILNRLMAPADSRGRYSCAQKKNSLLLPPGLPTGPPIV